jgi:hypothetical protein
MLMYSFPSYNRIVYALRATETKNTKSRLELASIFSPQFTVKNCFHQCYHLHTYVDVRSDKILICLNDYRF